MQGEIVVAVLAGQRAAVSHFDGHFGRNAAPLLALVHPGGELCVIGGLQHVSTFSSKAKAGFAWNKAQSPSRHARAGLSNELHQFLLQQRIEKLANIVLRLLRGNLKFFADAMQHLRDGVFILHEIPEKRADLIQGIKGVQIPDAVTYGHDDEFASDLACDYFAIADETHVIGKHVNWQTSSGAKVQDQNALSRSVRYWNVGVMV